METLKSRIKGHEGFRPEPSRDAGGWSIGYGHYIGNGQCCQISKQVADLVLDEDVHKATFEYSSLGLELDQVRQDVLIELIFWHGLKGWLGFVLANAALEGGHFGIVADEMMDSNSGRNHPKRMGKLAELMRTGLGTEVAPMAAAVPTVLLTSK
ncbi:MAG TPA: hypothetical protein ENH07_10215 [Nitrospirae bacterium]|nr:hypothetical protein [Nitrospirota bacterium]